MSKVFPSDELLADTDDVLCPYAESFAAMANPSATYLQSGWNSFADWSMNNAKGVFYTFLHPNTDTCQLSVWVFGAIYRVFHNERYFWNNYISGHMYYTCNIYAKIKQQNIRVYVHITCTWMLLTDFPLCRLLFGHGFRPSGGGAAPRTSAVRHIDESVVCRICQLAF